MTDLWCEWVNDLGCKRFREQENKQNPAHGIGVVFRGGGSEERRGVSSSGLVGGTCSSRVVASITKFTTVSEV